MRLAGLADDVLTNPALRDALDAAQAWRGAGVDDFPATLDLRRRQPRRWGRG